MANLITEGLENKHTHTHTGMNADCAHARHALHIESTAGEIVASGQVWRVEGHMPAMYVTRTAAPYKRQGSKKRSRCRKESLLK